MPERTAGPLTVSFLGGDLVPGLPKSVTLELVEPVSARQLLDLLQEATGIPDLGNKLARYHILVINGTRLHHLQGWDTVIRRGMTVSVVAPAGGG